MKKFLSIFIVSILLLSLFIVYGDKDDGIKIEAEVGFDKAYKPFYTTPVYITMNNGLKDIDGEIQIEIPNSEAYGNEVTLYSIGINHPKGTEKKYVMNIPIPSHMLNIKLKVVEGKKILSESYVRLDRNINENTMLVGVLSDSFDNIRYLNGFTYDSFSNTVSTKIVRLKEDTFPGSPDVMNNFDMIIINDFNTGNLTSEQYKALKSWTETGGFLVIGTGANGTKTLSTFTGTDNFVIGEIGDIKKLSGKALGSLINDDFDIPIDILDIDIKGATSIVTSAGVNFVQKLDKGQGSVLLLSFDLGLEPIASWKLNKYFVEHLIQSTAPALRVGSEYESRYPAGFNYNIDSALNNIPELPLPNYGTIIFIFILYIVLVAPVSYIVLKKMDKREYMWGVVPAFSVIFAAVVYFVGFGTRITEPLFNTVSVLRFNEGGLYEAKYYAGIFTPNKTTLKIQGSDDLKIKPFSRNNYYGSSGYQTWEDKKIEAKYTLYPKPGVEFYDIGVWGMKTFEVETDKGIKGSIISDIKFIDFDYSGFIENNMDVDLADCLIIVANQYIELGDIKKGERINISKGMNKNFTNRYELLDTLYPRYYQRDKKLKGDELITLRLGNKKRDLIEYFFNYEGQTIDGIKLIGWTKEPIIDDILVNNRSLKRYDNTMVAVDLNLSVRIGNTIELPFGYIKPSFKENDLIKGHYSDYDNMIYGEGTVEIDFNIDSNIKPEIIKIRFDTPSTSIKQYIWDYRSALWDERELSNFTIEYQDIESYLNETNVLKLKFEISNSEMKLPQISVKGSVK